jgi:hypothetical protein
MPPEALEGAGPFVKRADGFGVGAVELLATFAAYVNQAHIAQHAEMLGDGGLLQVKLENDVCDRPFLQGEEAEDVTAARFGDGVEGIGSGSGASHGKLLYADMGICQVIGHCS